MSQKRSALGGARHHEDDHDETHAPTALRPPFRRPVSALRVRLRIPGAHNPGHEPGQLPGLPPSAGLRRGGDRMTRWLDDPRRGYGLLAALYCIAVAMILGGI